MGLAKKYGMLYYFSSVYVMLLSIFVFFFLMRGFEFEAEKSELGAVHIGYRLSDFEKYYGKIQIM